MCYRCQRDTIIGICGLTIAFMIYLTVDTYQRDLRAVESKKVVADENDRLFKVLYIYGSTKHNYGYGMDCALEGTKTGDRIQADCHGNIPLSGEIWEVEPCRNIAWHAPYFLVKKHE